MRIFSFMLIAVVLALNLVPCDDAHGNCDESTIVYSADDGDANDNSGADFCTPFCHCSCCAASAIVKLYASIKAPFNSFKTPDLHYREACYTNISHSIWQPPKVI